MKSYKYDIFVSYSIKDKALVEILVNELTKFHLSVWFDQWNLTIGEEWNSALSKALKESKYIFLLVGEKPNIEKGWLEAEQLQIYEDTIDEENIVIPVLLPKSKLENIPIKFIKSHALDLRNGILDNPNLEVFVASIDTNGVIKRNLKKGQIAHESGRYTEAISYFLKVLELEPTNLVSLNNLAATYKEVGNFSEAIRLYEKAIQLQPQNASFYNNLAATFVAIKDFNQAISLYEKSLSLQPENASVYNNLAATYTNLGDYEKAILFYNKSLELQPQNAETYNNLASNFKNMKEYQKAIQYYNKALEIDPSNSSIYNNLSSLYQDKGELYKAKELSERALMLNPNSILSFNNLAGVYYDMKEYDKALEIYYRIIDMNSKLYGSDYFSSAVIFNNIGSILSKKGQYSEALNFLEKALVLYEKNNSKSDVAFVYNNIGELLIKTDRPQQAIEYFKRSLVIMNSTFGDKHKYSDLVLNNIKKAEKIEN